MNIQWHDDVYSRAVFSRMQELLSSFIELNFPKYSLFTVGVSRDDEKEEVIIKLHLRKLKSGRLMEIFK